MDESIQSSNESRFTDIYNEPVDHLLSPIKGYGTKPLVSLAEAVEPISGFFNKIADNVYVALHNCQNPTDELTQDESAAIHLYTMQFSGGPSLYALLNRSLRGENREDLKPWFSYLKLFLTALHKLPSQSGTVWRGIRDIDLSSQYKKGTKFAWWGVSSCTTDIEVLKSNKFLGNHGTRTLFSLDCINGKSAATHSYYKNTEKEIILMPGSYFEVEGQLNPAPGLYIIKLKEITPPIALIEAPFPKPIKQESTSVTHKSSTFSLLTPTKIISAISNLPVDAQWDQEGVTIAGGFGQGNANNQLDHPMGLFIAIDDIDDDQTIIIADYYNHRIMEWKGRNTSGRVVAGGNGKGNRLDQLNYPNRVLIDKETDSLIICDRYNRRVVRWSRRSGTTQGEILINNIYCSGLALDEQRYLYVSETEKHEVRRYEIDAGDKNGTVVAGGQGQGNRLNQLYNPYYIFVDRQQSVYVSDYENYRVMKWNKDAREGIIVAGDQGYGKTLAHLSYPTGLFVDTLGTVYVAERKSWLGYGYNQIIRWPKGERQGTIIVNKNDQGAEANQFHRPEDLTVDRHGNLYVVDSNNHRVLQFYRI